jgi:hypothetical protein
MEVAKMVGDQVKGGDTLHIPRFGSLSAKVYTPGSAMTATNQDWAYDTLVVSTYKYVNFYVDDARKLTLNVDQARELATEAAYQLKDAIDRHTFANITGADGFMPLDNQDVLGGTNGAPVSAGTANIINIFAGIRKFMREKNVEEAGDWCAVVTPKVASYIETKASVVGYNVADATLRNGYAGDFMGFQIYISNNLPTGLLTAIAPNIGTGLSGLSNTSGNSGTVGRATYFGRKGQINLALMREPQMYVVQDPVRIGKNYVTWTVYGSNVTYTQARRGCNLSMSTAFAG